MSLDEAEDVYNNLPQDIYAKNDGVIETIGVTDCTAAKGTVAVSILTSESNTVEFNIGRYDIGDIQVGQKTLPPSAAWNIPVQSPTSTRLPRTTRSVPKSPWTIRRV